MADTYELYYWHMIPGRGEFVRLVFEEAGVEYVDVARHAEEREGGGVAAVRRYMTGEAVGNPVYAPPILRVGDLVLSQTANICLFLARRFEMAPTEETRMFRANQVALTIMDVVKEAHDTHHPLGTSYYYEDQKKEAKKNADQFLRERLPRFFRHFESLLESADGPYLLGDCTYVDLMMFQLMEGLKYALPHGFEDKVSEAERLLELHDRVGTRPRIESYLNSDRRMPFNENGIFRRYPELDIDAT